MREGNPNEHKAHEEAIRSIMAGLLPDFDHDSLQKIESACHRGLRGYDVIRTEVVNTGLSVDVSPDVRAYEMFFVAKKVEGLSDKTLIYYKYVIDRFLEFVQKPLNHIIADDVRLYFASRHGVSKVTLNNERRNLSSFFGWLTVEEYISKNPILKIGTIKQTKKVKKPFSAEEIESMRAVSLSVRNRAIFEVLLSTGMRASEMVNADRADVSLTSSEIVVNGKGGKQRICYLNAAAKKHLSDYLASRTDNNPALFTGMFNWSNRRLQIGGFATAIKEIGNRAQVSNVHMHRFRRTAATTALKRGMEIDQVRVLLGHELMATTTLYAITADETVKHSHAKFM